jgi:hypothetical protein
MANRITQKYLEELVALVNTFDINNPLDINYSSCYGGYQITYNNGSSILMHRKSAKETKAFLDGIHAGRYLRSRQMMGEVA